MGVLKDLGTSTVHDLCRLTGYPRDSYGHLLNPLSHRDGCPEKDWDKAGTELYNLTNPYGHLHFACGSGDDFYCFDYKKINAGPRGEFIILHATINCETGHFIDGAGYEVMPCNSTGECKLALDVATGMVDRADSWCADNGVRHTKWGWNQSMWYFRNAVARCLFKIDFQKYVAKRRAWEDSVSEREIRMNSKRVEKIITSIYKDK